MLDSIYHYDAKHTLKSRFWGENAKILPHICDVAMGLIT